MNLLEYKETYGREAAIQLAESAGTTYAYYKQMMRGHRRPSIDLAHRFVSASKKKLSLIALLGGENADTNKRNESKNRNVQKKGNRANKPRNKYKA